LISPGISEFQHTETREQGQQERTTSLTTSPGTQILKHSDQSRIKSQFFFFCMSSSHLPQNQRCSKLTSWLLKILQGPLVCLLIMTTPKYSLHSFLKLCQ